MNDFGLMLRRITVSCFVVTALTIVNPMNPIFTTTFKDNSDGNRYYSKNNLLKQLTIYSAVGVVGYFDSARDHDASLSDLVRQITTLDRLLE